MRAHMTWLDEAEKRSFVEEALGILERVGVELKGSAALPVLADLGADVDAATGVVRLPADLVRRSVEACPRRILFAGASPEYDVVLDEGEAAHFCSSGCAAFVIDHKTGVRRPSTLTDLQAATILLDEVPEVDVMWTTITASDVPVEVRELVVGYVVLTEGRKHVTLVDSPSQAEPLLAIMEVVSGDAEAFRARPRFSTLLTAASPLRIDGPLLDFHAATARRGAPVEVYTVPMAGATSPVTLAGTIVQGLAEFLGVATALQALAPGARVVMGVSGSVMDMRSASVSYASPETALMNVACVELAHHLGVPAAVPGLATDAKYAGLQTGYEKALKGLATAGVGADVLSGGVGMIDSVNSLFLPQIVVDAEIVGMIHRILGDVDVRPEQMMLDMIERVGIGGDFLREKETARRLRAGEHFMPAISTRQAYDQWVADGRDEVARARERMDALFAARAERGRPVADDVRAELARICRVSPEMARALGD
ncbi:MAG TPA: trimethylamine methyltransferase family protein [Thermoleophilia bacterium]|nr:trimethylamine methyltransferase family protein [Thermoleophilia bacterium]